MSSKSDQTETASKMFGAVMAALKNKCTCEPCVALRSIGAEMIDTLLNPKVPKTRK